MNLIQIERQDPGFEPGTPGFSNTYLRFYLTWVMGKSHGTFNFFRPCCLPSSSHIRCRTKIFFLWTFVKINIQFSFSIFNFSRNRYVFFSITCDMQYFYSPYIMFIMRKWWNFQISLVIKYNEYLGYFIHLFILFIVYFVSRKMHKYL